MSRPIAEMTPTDSDWSCPNGLPIAATGEPTTRSCELPSRSGVSVSPAGLSFSSATSELRSSPTTLAGTRLPSENVTYTASARSSSGGSLRITCAFVATKPSPSSTNPEPSPPRPSSPVSALIVTTPGARRR
jgi:hypothetical protein